jgi:DNA-binding NarL/FixJ family response regulator
MNCQLVEQAFRPRRLRLAVIASAVESTRAISLLKEHAPDVAIISAQLHEGPLAGFRVLRELRRLRAKTRAVMLLDTRKRELIIEAFRNGAHGVIFRDEPLETLSKCIHAVHRGQVWADSELLGLLLEALGQTKSLNLQDAHGLDLLSKKEEKVVRLVASALGLSEHTVRNYLFKIFDKVGVSTRVELVLYCLQEKHSSAEMAS